ncbi:MAG: M1 family metallopeptidase [Marmoricola sp.]
MSGTDPYVPGHGDATFSVLHYDLDLRYNPETNRLDGDATLTCRTVLPAIALHVDLRGLAAGKVSTRGIRLARWTQRVDGVQLTASGSVPAGTDFTVRIRYSGHPGTVHDPALGDAGWEELTDGVIVAAQPHGAPAWFPCNDRPDDKATYSLSTTVPAGYVVAASGEPGPTRRGGSTTTWTHEQRYPMAAYLASLQIGRYDVRHLPGDVPIRVVAPADVGGPDFDASFGQQPAMMSFFVDRFGPYPFDSYTSVVTDDPLEIPLESQSLSTFGRNFVSADWHAVRLVAHELAHQWFGNAVTASSWSDIWLHEGFACYAEWLWSEESGGRSAAEWAEHYHQVLADQAQDLVLENPGPELMFDDRVYKRGALTLHVLRCTVGDTAFFDILRTWVADRAGSSVNTAEFLEHCGRVSGEVSVSAALRPWLESPDLPTLPA